MASRKLEIVITGDARGLERAFGKAGKDSQTFGRRVAGGLKVAGIAAGLAGAAIGTGLGIAARAGFQELADGQRVAAQTAAVLKSTAGVANVTAGEIEGLAGQISLLSGVDDEVIQAGQNMLLTFKNIRNEAGKGNDIFDQSTRALIDMSVAMGKEPRQAAIQLGKALNDPVKGVTALGRAGVQFTDAQRDAIKAMVESGDTMGAQKIILKELESQFGGSAKAAGDTFPGQMNKLRNAFDDVAARLLKGLLPTLTALAGWLANTGLPAMERFFGGTKRLVEQHWPRVQAVIQSVIAWIKANVVPTATAVAAGIQAAWARIGPVAKAAFEGALNVIKPTMRTIQAVIETVLALIRGDWSEVWQGLKEIAVNALRVGAAAVRATVGLYLAAAKAIGKAIWDGIKAGLAGLAGLAKELVAGVARAVGAAVQSAYTWATGIGRAMVSGIVDGLVSLPGRIASAAGGLIKQGLGAIDVPGFSPPASAAAKAVGHPIAEGIAKGIMEKGAVVKAALSQTIRDAIRDAKANLSSLAGSLASSIGAGIDARATSRLAGVDNSPEAQRLKAIEDSQRAAEVAAERFRLEQAIVTTNSADEQKEAQRALDAFLLAQEAETLRLSLEQKRTAIADEEADRKTALERGLADLADQFNRGEIRAAQFHKRLQGKLRAAGVDYADIGRMLGSSFANAFRDQLRAVANQVREIAGASQVDRITGSEPGVTQVQRRAAPPRPVTTKGGSAKTVNITVNAQGKVADEPGALAGRIGRELAIAGI